jgi:NAD(P)-dependent dehydrogenase (short-subunit alcohol dehydrogenase family)
MSVLNDRPAGLSGKRALVTGAGKGIGRETVGYLTACGMHVVALSRSPDDLAALQKETECETIATDLADLDHALPLVRAALPFDFLVNNAGITRLAPVLEMPEADFSDVIRINTLAPLRLAQVVGADMIARGLPGSIVNVSSVASGMGLPLHAAYCASKAALDALTRVLAVELGPKGIRTNSVNPTVTLTPMATLAWSDPEKADQVKARIPLGRFADPRDVVSVIAFLLSDAAAMINGACLNVDGGLSAS